MIAALFKGAVLIERYGSGIRRIMESFAEDDLQSPVFEELVATEKVTGR